MVGSNYQPQMEPGLNTDEIPTDREAIPRIKDGKLKSRSTCRPYPWDRLAIRGHTLFGLTVGSCSDFSSPVSYVLVWLIKYSGP